MHMEDFKMNITKYNSQTAISFFKEKPKYETIVTHIQESLPTIIKKSEIFYKDHSQFMNSTLDGAGSAITPIRSLYHISAEIEKTKSALEDHYISEKRNNLKIKRIMDELEESVTSDPYRKEELQIDLEELFIKKETIQNYVGGALRKLSFLIEQYNGILRHIDKEFITEEDYEIDEHRYHIMTAFKQALTAARGRGGVVDEGNMIYFFDLGINGTVAQKEILEYLQIESNMLIKGMEPTFETEIAWLNHCADKFLDCPRKKAEFKGLKLMDKNSLL